MKLTSLALLLLAPSAHALEQLTHRDVTLEGCSQANLDPEFCTLTATASVNVDGEEWDRMSAHAQADAPDKLCDGAKNVITRARTLGAEFAAHAVNVHDDGERALAAKALGKLLHMAQDNCAHSGMPNVQHAWWSASDTCTGSHLSPDLNPPALSCSKLASAALFAEVLKTVDRSALAVEHAYESRLLPDAPGLCEYMLSADEWDGIDRRWEQKPIEDLLVTATRAGLDGLPAPEVSCENLEAEPAANVDTRKGAPTCAAADSLCASAGRSPNGCQATEGSLALLAMAAVSLRTRTRTRSGSTAG